MKRITIFRTGIVALLLLTIGSVAFAGNATADHWNNSSERENYLENESGYENFTLGSNALLMPHENDTIEGLDAHLFNEEFFKDGSGINIVAIGADKIIFNETVNVTADITIIPLTNEELNQSYEQGRINKSQRDNWDTYNSMILDFTSENATLNELYQGNLQWDSSVTKIDGNVVGTIDGAIITEKRLIIIFASFALAIGTAALALGVSQSDKF